MTDATAPETQAAPPPSAPLSKAYQNYALALLLAIYTLNFLDRQVVNILAEPIKRDLHLKDWQLGMMTGLAFAIFYTGFAIPIARLADRANRPLIIAGAVAVWSFFTAVCGLAGNFVQLFLARVGVGIGEAGCSPPSHSLISDYVAPGKRASALAFYSLGTPLGSLLGAAMGGIVADAWGWRAAFLLAGAPGLVVALLAAFTLREPRKHAAGAAAAQADQPPLMDALREIASKRTFWLFALGGAAMAFVGYAQVAFAPSFFFRAHAAELVTLSASIGLKPTGFVGLVLGVIGGIAGLVGTFAGGQLADRLGARDRRWHPTIAAVAGLVGAPFFLAAMLAPNVMLAIVLLIGPNLASSMWYGPIYGSTQSLVRPRTRAMAAAVILFIINIIGLGLGPLGLGILSDVLAGPMGLGESEGLRWALISSEAGILLAALLFWMARGSIRKDSVS